jgi:hypothetical protein
MPGEPIGKSLPSLALRSPQHRGCRYTIRQRLGNVPFFEIHRLLENDLTTGAPRLNPPVSSFDH